MARLLNVSCLAAIAMLLGVSLSGASAAELHVPVPEQQTEQALQKQQQALISQAHYHASSHASSQTQSTQLLRQRKLAQEPSGWKPSSDEKQKSKDAGGHFSASHAAVVLLLCLVGVALLGYSGYKAMQWYEGFKRPGYVEMQSMDTAYHRPWAF